MEEERVKFYHLEEGEELTLTGYRSVIETRIKAPLEMAFPVLVENAGCLGDEGDGAIATISSILLLWDLIEERVGEDIKKAYEAKKGAEKCQS